MAYLSTPICQHFATGELPGAVRAALGKPLRRAATINQLAVVGALATVPENRRELSTALLWQSTGGPRSETQALLREVCAGSGEAMPYDFLAIQPAIAAPQIQGFLPGLQSASYFPLDNEATAQWALVLNLALNLLDEGRYAQILCAHLDVTSESATGYWLNLSQAPLENSVIRLQLSQQQASEALPNTPDFPRQLIHWLEHTSSGTLSLQSPAAYQQALEFTRL